MWPKRQTKAPSGNARGLIHGYRSGLEEVVGDQLDKLGVPYDYEKWTVRYTVPAREAKYKFDFILPNGIIIETKGRFVTADRQKHKIIKEQHPDLDIRFVFSNPKSKIGKLSKTTYGMWCERLGIQYAAKVIPEDWLEEPDVPSRILAATRITGWTPPKRK